MHPIFERHKLRLRKLNRQDLPRLLELKQETWNETHHVTLNNADDQTKWFESLDPHPHFPTNLIMVGDETKTNNSVGIFKISNIDWVSRTADVGWDIFLDWRRVGFGAEIVKTGADFCFSVLNLRRLTAEILEHNIPSAKCAIRAGFVLEGQKREAIYKDGRFMDSNLFGLLGRQFGLIMRSTSCQDN